jgi:hypothetical protein
MKLESREASVLLFYTALLSEPGPPVNYINPFLKLGTVAHTCNPSYLGEVQIERIVI